MARRSTPRPPQPVNLTPEKMQMGIHLLERRLDQVKSLDFTEGTVDVLENRAQAADAAINSTLDRIFGADSIERERYQQAGMLRRGMFVAGMSASDSSHIHINHQQRSISLLGAAIAELEERLADDNGAIVVTLGPFGNSPPSQKVFVVHGRNDAVRESIARFLERLGLEPIILHERPNGGRNLITKFQEESSDIGFAVVLLTPDDIGGLVSTATENLTARARQNVVFELGFFIGCLGPDRVCPIIVGDVDIPSDYQGVAYVRFSDAGGWKSELCRELKHAGYDIDANLMFD